MLTVLMNKRNDKITLCSDGRVSFFHVREIVSDRSKKLLKGKKSRKKVASPHLSEETFLLMLQGGPKMAVKLGRS